MSKEGERERRRRRRKRRGGGGGLEEVATAPYLDGSSGGNKKQQAQVSIRNGTQIDSGLGESKSTHNSLIFQTMVERKIQYRMC